MMKVDHYMDLQCVKCGCNRSTDFEKGLFQGKPGFLVRLARAEGWKTDRETSLPICPRCAKPEKKKENA